MVNNILKVIGEERPFQGDAAFTTSSSPFLFFPFDDTDLLDIHTKWEEAKSVCNTLRLDYPTARVVVMRKPKIPGPWQEAEIIGENTTRETDGLIYDDDI